MIPDKLSDQAEDVVDYAFSPLDDRLDSVVEDDSIRYLVDRWYPLVLGGLLLVAVVAGYTAFAAYSSPATVSQQEVASEWTVQTSWSHSAEAERSGVLYREGEVLENQPAYFSNLTSTVDLVYRVQHGGQAVEPADFDVDLRIYREAPAGEDSYYWRESEYLGSESFDSVEPGELVEAEVAVDPAAQRDRITRIERDLGASPGDSRFVVEAVVQASTQAAGEPVEVERTDVARFDVGSGTFSVDASSGSSSDEVLRTVERPAPRSPVSLYGAPVVSLLALLAGYGVVRGRRRGAFDLEEDVRLRLEFERQRDDLDEWISRGDAPDEGVDVELDSLEDVVDVAIDSDRRVVEDDGEFVVFVDDLRYVYRPEFTQ